MKKKISLYLLHKNQIHIFTSPETCKNVITYEICPPSLLNINDSTVSLLRETTYGLLNVCLMVYNFSR